MDSPEYTYVNPFTAPLRRQRNKARVSSRFITIVAIIVIWGVALTVVNIYEIHKMRIEHDGPVHPVVEGAVGKETKKSPLVWIEAKKKETGYLKHVFAVFERIGYVFGEADSDWDVMWSHDYPFVKLAAYVSNLKPHQKVNHFPGSGYITSKVSLATSPFSFMPLAFKLPSDKDMFLNHSKHHPDKMWVQKSNNHRGIQIKKITSLDLDNVDTFVQEYISRPFLIDGKKFDIGVYTILTSIDPLRIYIVDSDVLLRFCIKDYYPFDAGDTPKYVVEDNYTPVWDMPSLRKIYEDMHHSFKDTFDIYLKQQGLNADKMWSDIRDAIASVHLEKEPLMKKASSKYKNGRNFFEMVRFDFVLDIDMKLYLMEVNMSPNLSSGFLSQNRFLYEHVVYNTLSLVGVAKSVPESVSKSSDAAYEMQVSDRNIVVFGDLCATQKCAKSCLIEECVLCHQCLTLDQKKILKSAYLEHINRGTCRRVFPPKIVHREALEWREAGAGDYFKSLSAANKLMYMWFVGKCRQDEAWCQ
ncbi:hypothetical protein ScPMuIL_014650 [Solemya velum]